MITPRRTTLLRVPDLARFRTTITTWILDLDPGEARDAVVIVPTRAAAEQLRRTVEDRAAGGSRQAFVWPVVGTRGDAYLELASRLPSPAPRLSEFEREVIIGAVAREVADTGILPPFQLRPRLIAEMVALYDHVRRLGRTVDDFARNVQAELEREQDVDRGAERLLQQTRFLVAVFRGYESRLTDSGRSDEHGLRRELLDGAPLRPVRRVLVTVADRLADADGLWPADLDLLTRLPGLDRLDLLCTEASLGAGYLERLHAALPELDEHRSPASPRAVPMLVTYASAEVGSADAIVSSHRDREDELAAVARRLKLAHRAPTPTPLHRSALVVRRPLPYLYLARDVFADAGIPFETLDTLPLAAEPYAAAVDVVLEAVAADFTRGSLLALLRSPHFRLGETRADREPAAEADQETAAEADQETDKETDRETDKDTDKETAPLAAPGPPAAPRSRALDEAAIAACDFALADARYLGGLDRLHVLVAQWSSLGPAASRRERRQQASLPAARAALAAARALQPLADSRPIVDQIATLGDWLRRFDRADGAPAPVRARRQRVRAAVLGALAALADAHARHDPGACADVTALSATLRRWLGAQTFATRSGVAGLQIVDTQAARYGDFDDVQIVGLIEGEWPDRVRRNVLYPSSLMALLEPLPALADPARRDRDLLQSARAAFRDLVLSAATRVRLSTVALENDAVVAPSVLLDEVAGFGLPAERCSSPPIRVSFAEALALSPPRIEVLPPPAAAWAALRVPADDREASQFRGDAGAWRLPRVSVSRLERYLDCPFRFYASEVLRIEEQPEDEDTRTPLERGRFLHELWERFFAAWQARGYGRVEPEQLAEARALFERICEEALGTLPPVEAVLERSRLLGSALSPGIAHRVFAMEAERPGAISRRLLEYPLQGDFAFRARDGRARVVTVSAKTDRIDVLADGTLRVIDYKSKQTPDLKVALQLPIYSVCARESLRASTGRSWEIGEAMYLSFEGDKAVVPLRAKGRTIDDLLADAQDRLLAALDGIAAGHFPPQPARKALCGPCPYRAVCRLEIVEAVVEAVAESPAVAGPDTVAGGATETDPGTADE